MPKLYLGMEIPNWPPNNIDELSKKEYFCDLCEEDFANFTLFRQHIDQKHNKNQYKMKFPKSGKYKAVAVRKAKRRSKILKKDNIFYDNFDSKAKGKTTHKELTSYWCSKCQKFFQNFDLLQAHMKKDHSQGDVGAKRSISKGTFYEKF